MEKKNDSIPPQLSLPLPQFNLKESTLFHLNDNDNNDNYSTITSIPSYNTQEANNSYRFNEDIKEFRSSTGKVISLIKKSQNCYDSDNNTLHLHNITWKDDKSYGINISYLLDKIVAKTEKKISTITGHNNNRYNVTKLNSSAKNNKNKLWVEKWRPKKFLDLVGNDKTNRRILGWLRKWSYAVFKEDLEIPPFQKALLERNPQQLRDKPEDLFRRPKKKILLIHGPPGIGKTSVVHVVAKQAGYSVAEINASDERSGSMMKHKIQNTLFNHTFNEKPLCLIADEIDGAIENGFIKVLLDILQNDIKATKKASFNKGNSFAAQRKNSKGKEGKNLKTSKVLLRPIIAICNNLYAPALERLRPFCEIISVKRPPESALQERLLYICEKEHINFDTKTLKNLIDLAEGDIRNCINNLQFMSTNLANQHIINNGVNIMGESSQKDTTLLWFKLVNKVFKKDPYKESKIQLNELLSGIEQNGSYEKIIQGCFNSYPFVKYTDSGVTKPAEISDWLYFNDLMQKSLFEQNGELVKYSSITPLIFYTKFSDIANNKENIKVTNLEYEMRETRKQNEAIFKSLLSKISNQNAHLAETLSMKSLIFEIMPYLNDIISTDLLKIKDIGLKNHIIKVLSNLFRQYQLTLLPIENEYPHLHQTVSVLGINPPFHKVVLFDEQRKKEIYIKRPQILEVLLAKSEEMKVKKRHLNQIQQEKADLEENKLKNKRTKMAGSNTVNFFKNQYDTINSQLEDHNVESDNAFTNTKIVSVSSVNNNIEVSRIWVRYKAGFSNAVRKNVTWENLWD